MAFPVWDCACVLMCACVFSVSGVTTTSFSEQGLVLIIITLTSKHALWCQAVGFHKCLMRSLFVFHSAHFFIIKSSKWLGTKCLIFSSNSTQSAHQKLPKRDKRNQRDANEHNVTTLPLLYLKKKKRLRKIFSLTQICCSLNIGDVDRDMGHLYLCKPQLRP